MDEESITKQYKDLVKSIREYSASQVEDWRKVPELAKDAASKALIENQLMRVYRTGHWATQYNSEGGCEVYVQLSTGDLITEVTENLARPAPDSEVLKIASNIEQLNCKKIISFLELVARRPI